MNVDKLRKMAGLFRTGGKGIMRRKKKAVHKTTTDDKKLRSTLKRIGVDAIPAIEEVNIFKEDVVIQFTNPKGKPKMSRKQKKKRRLLGEESSQDDLLEKKGNVADDEVDQMSSGDEDYSKGMKKWVMQYHQSRPGIKVLQERIDDFITAHDAQEEQARMEREAKAAEGGWTVVVQHKGRKKTTEAESGIAVGSVAQAAVLDKMAKKKSKDVGLDFYRFQRREAHRNEIMMLQSKFEQDKKRIQEMRAARKFRPY